MVTNNWKKALKFSELEDNVPKAVTINEEDIILVKINSNIYAYGGSCPHYGAPLAEGHLSGHELTCPWHNARFDLKNGKMLSPPALDDLPAYEVKIENDEIYIGGEKSKEIPVKGETDTSSGILIIGAGAAGNSAAETLRREGFKGKITMLTAEEDLPYDRPVLSKDYMANTAEEEWVPLRSEEFYTQQGIDVLTGVRIKELDIDEKSALAEDGKKFSYDKCLLATGGTPKTLDIPGVDKKNIFLLRSFKNARDINNALDDAKNILVIGTGFIGLETAASLRERDKTVTVVSPDKIPLEKAFGEKIGLYLKSLHEDNQVKFHFEQSVKEFRGGNSVEEAVLSDGASIKTDLVIIGIGVKPAVEYLTGTNLAEDGAVPVNENFQTKNNSVYAAGDIAAYPDPATGKLNRIEHWVVAERQGGYAAKAMLGKSAAFNEAPFFWTRQYGNSLKYIGHVGEFDEVAYRGNVDEGNFLAGYYYQGNLRAAAAMGMGDELFIVEKIIEKGKELGIEQFQDKKFELNALLD